MWRHYSVVVSWISCSMHVSSLKLDHIQPRFMYAKEKCGGSLINNFMYLTWLFHNHLKSKCRLKKWFLKQGHQCNVRLKLVLVIDGWKTSIFNEFSLSVLSVKLYHVNQKLATCSYNVIFTYSHFIILSVETRHEIPFGDIKSVPNQFVLTCLII